MEKVLLLWQNLFQVLILLTFGIVLLKKSYLLDPSWFSILHVEKSFDTWPLLPPSRYVEVNQHVIHFFNHSQQIRCWHSAGPSLQMSLKHCFLFLWYTNYTFFLSTTLDSQCPGTLKCFLWLGNLSCPDNWWYALNQLRGNKSLQKSCCFIYERNNLLS